MLTDAGKSEIMSDWFGGESDKYDMFRTAMGKLKDYSFNGAHPTQLLDGTPVDAAAAKRLVMEKMPESRRGGWRQPKERWTDQELKNLVNEYIDKLTTVRLANSQTQFLY